MMSFSNGQYMPATPVVSQRAGAGRRVVQSLWLLFGLLSVGLLGFAGYILVAAQTKRDRWWAFASFWFVIAGSALVAAALAPTDTNGDLSSSVPGSVMTVLLAILWIVGGISSVVTVPFIWRDYDTVKRVGA